jgi:type III restriction enzyme
LLEEIHPDAAQGEAPEVPRYETGRGPGTTADVSFWTSKEVREIVKSHVNFIVADTQSWEQKAAFELDRHEKVEAFVKNEQLGFGISYLHNGQIREYIPDFLVRIRTGNGPPTMLILEIKGFRDPLKDVKAQAAERWAAAVNAEGSHGRWCYRMARSAGEVAGIVLGVSG